MRPASSAGAVGCTIKAFPAGHRSIARFEDYGARFLLIDGASPGAGEPFDWRLAEGVADPGRLIVSGGLRADNVGAAIAHLRPWGVDVSSGVEASPGVKDPTKLRDFMNAARTAAVIAATRPDEPTAEHPAVGRTVRLAGRLRVSATIRWSWATRDRRAASGASAADSCPSHSCRPAWSSSPPSGKRGPIPPSGPSSTASCGTTAVGRRR